MRTLRNRFGHEYSFAFTPEESAAALGLRTREQALKTLRLMSEAGDLHFHDGDRMTANVDGQRMHVVIGRGDRLGVQRLGHARRYDARRLAVQPWR